MNAYVRSTFIDLMSLTDYSISSFRSQPIIQQDLKRLRLRSTPFCMSVILYFLAVVYLIFFSELGLAMNNLNEISINYGEQCSGFQTCIVTVNLTKPLKAPWGMYYKLTNFYQFHKSIAGSYSSLQLRGKIASESQLVDCQPKTYINDTIHMSNVLVPCGAFSTSVFNDTFSLLGFSNLDENDIALSVDKTKLYLRPNSFYDNSSMWLEDTGLFPNGIINPHFITWMRAAAFVPFRKLYGISDKHDLPAGQYLIFIQNNYPLKFFGGSKYLILQEIRLFGTNLSGNKIVFLSIALFLFVASAIEGYIGWKRSKPNSKFHPDNLRVMFVNSG